MPKRKSRSKKIQDQDDLNPVDGDEGGEDSCNDDGDAVSDGMLWDLITDEQVKDTPKEQVVQRIARALFHEYNIPMEDMERNFPIAVGGKGRGQKADIAIFESEQPHELAHLRRVVVCKPEPTLGKRGTTKLRDHEQAAKDLEIVEKMLSAEGADQATLGLWTNGLELFFIEKKANSWGEAEFEAIGSWPPAGESIGTEELASYQSVRQADKDMLKIAFRRCHNWLHGNEGHSKEQAFRQFLFLIFCKIHDEQVGALKTRRFFAYPTEPFNPEGQKKIRERIAKLFEEVRENHPDIFGTNDQLQLSNRALGFIVAELQRYDFLRTPLDVKGAAYQEIIGPSLRGDLGQYFTPPDAIKLLVDMVDPQPNEKVLDPSCGTGGFLIACLNHQRNRMENGDDTRSVLNVHKALTNYAKTNVYGCDFSDFLVKAARMNLAMSSDSSGQIFHMNSLEFPAGDFDGLDVARKRLKFDNNGNGPMDVVFSNPPFGKTIPITDPQILEQFDLGHTWDPVEGGGYRRGKRKASVEPQILFIERCLKWLKPGGRLGIVLPDGVLGSPGTAYIRWWIMQQAYVMASVKLPVESFLVEANVGILTTLLYLRKKTTEQYRADQLDRKKQDYPVFMAVAENVGVDRRGNKRYKRNPDGTEITKTEPITERRRINGVMREAKLLRRQRVIDNDLPVIADQYQEFRKRFTSDLAKLEKAEKS